MTSAIGNYQHSTGNTYGGFGNDVLDALGWGSASRDRTYNAEQAMLNRQFQEYMSNTAHQREIADLKAAGINPILTATGGMGAYTPGGSQASSNSGAHSGKFLSNAIRIVEIATGQKNKAAEYTIGFGK